ncbi:MAG: DUF2797 domain-containing protein [Arenicellales bacterium]|jgi:hypothetical protein
MVGQFIRNEVKEVYMSAGVIQKMHTKAASPVEYQLPIGEALVGLNALLGRELEIEFCGEIFCLACGRKTNKSFNQGHCYPCFKRLAACDQCIIKPELCHFHKGTCREPDWGQAHCLQPHIVYLANSSGLKVGVTRATQIPTRWIDQGASQALPIFEVSERRIAGLLEVAIRTVVSDRTNWRRMLKGTPDQLDLVAERERLLAQADAAIAPVTEAIDPGQVRLMEEVSPVQIQYPVNQYPEKVTALNLDKTPRVAGRLLGIKGQYLILDSGVLNIRKFGGYRLTLEH